LGSVQRIVDRVEYGREVEPEHPEGDDARERDQRGDQAIFDGRGGALIAEEVRCSVGPHVPVPLSNVPSMVPGRE